MVEIVLLIIGIVWAVRRPKLRRLTSQDYPGVDPAKFAQWQCAELKATDIFLWATWGVFVIKLGLIIMAAASGADSEIGAYASLGTIIAIFAWAIGLAIAGAFWSKAKKLRLSAGIQWPKKL